MTEPGGPRTRPARQARLTSPASASAPAACSGVLRITTARPRSSPIARAKQERRDAGGAQVLDVAQVDHDPLDRLAGEDPSRRSSISAWARSMEPRAWQTTSLDCRTITSDSDPGNGP